MFTFSWVDVGIAEIDFSINSDIRLNWLTRFAMLCLAEATLCNVIPFLINYLDIFCPEITSLHCVIQCLTVLYGVKPFVIIINKQTATNP